MRTAKEGFQTREGYRLALTAKLQLRRAPKVTLHIKKTWEIFALGVFSKSFFSRELESLLYDRKGSRPAAREAFRSDFPKPSRLCTQSSIWEMPEGTRGPCPPWREKLADPFSQ